MNHKIGQDVKGHPGAKVHLIQAGCLVATVTDKAFFTPVCGQSMVGKISRSQTKGDLRGGRSRRVRMHVDKLELCIRLQTRRRSIVGIQCYYGLPTMSDGKLRFFQIRKALLGPVWYSRKYVNATRNRSPTSLDIGNVSASRPSC